MDKILENMIEKDINRGEYTDNSILNTTNVLQQNEILRFILNNGMIDLDDVESRMNAMKSQKLLKQHKNKVWQGKDGKWRTYLPDTQKGRVLKKRATEKEIQELIIDYYKGLEKEKEAVSFYDYFLIWKDRQTKIGVSDATISKYNTDFKRFFLDDSLGFSSLDIRKIDDKRIEDYIFRTLDRLHIKYRAFQQMFSMMNNIFRKAKLDKVIKDNPCEYIDIQLYKRKCDDSGFDPEKRVLDEDGIKRVLDVIRKEHIENPNYIPIYALELALLTGMRAGELAFLRWEHIDYQNGYLKVCGSEKYNQDKKVFFDDKTKTGKERRIPLTEEMIAFFKNLQMIEIKYGYISNHVFSNENGRIHRNTLCTCAVKKCAQAGVAARGLQVARRTFNSQLRTQGVSTVVASSILGHSEQVNERYYTYDVSNMDYKREVVENINKKIRNA